MSKKEARKAPGFIPLRLAHLQLAGLHLPDCCLANRIVCP
jgi:hypothetical protein